MDNTTKVPAPSPPYRPNTGITCAQVALIYNSGGIGDYIQWTTAIRYAIKSTPHIYGYVITPPYFEDLARLWLDGYDERFEVRVEAVSNYADVPYINDGRTIIIAPDRGQFANATGFHLFSLGFTYYAQKDLMLVPPEWIALPEVRGDEVPLGHLKLPERYAVIVPTGVDKNRILTGGAINGAVSFLRSRGITPVFLGKGPYTTGRFAILPEGVRGEGVLNLINQTSLVEAACVMDGALLTLGMDSGLMHLASCTKSPTVWLFTSVDPRLRLPPRPADRKTAVITPPESLACRFCSSQARYVINHDFAGCLYGDNECVKTLTAERIVAVLKEVLK